MIDSTSSTSASCSWVGPRIIDKVAAAQCAGQRFYALEFFPPATIEGARNLIPRMDRLAQLQPPPLFVDVTWTLSAGKRALETLVAAKAVCALDVQMHLSCTDLTRETAELVLTDAAQAGIRGIMVLRGDPPTGSKEWQPIEDGFKNPGELVSFIKHKYGDHFSISVAGHPGGHPTHQNASQESQLDYLASKVKTGADMIVTQMIFAAAEYKSFVDACRARGKF